MDTSVSSPSWHTRLYDPQFVESLVDCRPQGEHAHTDPLFEDRTSSQLRAYRARSPQPYQDSHSPHTSDWGPQESVSSGVGIDELERHAHYDEFPGTDCTARPVARHYHQHEEDQTDFRSQAVSDYNVVADSITSDGSIKPTNSTSRYSQHYDVFSNRDDLERQKEDLSIGTESGDNNWMSGNDTSKSGPGQSNGGRCQYGDVQDFVEGEFFSDGEDEANEAFCHNEFTGHSWHREHHHDNNSADWKRPDIHMFKASSYKGSVASDKSSRLDQHTYQSYAAGLLYSSGRSEKFLKLQKHFAVLERIGELDTKSSTGRTTSSADHSLQWQELASSAQTLHSQEELQELQTELKEAKKKKEFFYSADKAEEAKWSPEKDFGLKNREHTLRDQVITYRNLVDERLLKSSAASKEDTMKRSVSFGALYEKFHSSESTDLHQGSSRHSVKSDGRDHNVERDGWFSTKPLPSDQVEAPSSVSMKQSVSSSSLKQPSSGSSPVSYLQLMENAAKKARQRAIHGTHLDSPCNEYEAYVKEVKKINKHDAEFNRNSFQSSLKPFVRHSRHDDAVPERPAVKVKGQEMKESTTKAGGESRELAPADHQIVVHAFSTPKPELSVKPQCFDSRLVGHSPSTAVAQPSTNQENMSTVEVLAPGNYSESPNTTLSEASMERPVLSQMPDIIQMEKHYKPPENVPTKKEQSSSFSVSTKSHSQKRSPFADEVCVALQTGGTGEHNKQTERKQRFDHEELKLTKQTVEPSSQIQRFGPVEQVIGQSSQNGRCVHREQDSAFKPTEKSQPGPAGKGAVFQVRNLRTLAENNEFSNNQLSWMKKPSSSHREIDGGYRHRVQGPATSESAQTVRQVWSAPKTGVEKSSEAFVSQSSVFTFPQQGKPSQDSFTVARNVSDFGKKTFVTSRSPESHNFKPVPSQSGPSFSASKRGTEARARQTENSRHGGEVSSRNVLPNNGFASNSMKRISQPEISQATQMETISGCTAISKPMYTASEASGQRPGPERREAAMGRGPGDGSDSLADPSDNQYGQLRKWTAVADIYRDVEKSWSPTRETRAFPLENNSSISSTDTFIVKDTDGEQDDLESSASSVSRLRKIFERQQTVSKSRSEPDMSVDSSEEPKRPRSAKSQVNLKDMIEEEASSAQIHRTVSGDLREIRSHYTDRPANAGRQLPEFQPDTVTEHTRPTDVALKAWVHYTERPKYDPYLPPEDILKEVSAASTGRKLDVPKQKTHRPSNVSRMTLEYFNQIGCEWQQSNLNRGYAPQGFRSAPVQDTAPAQQVDRRYVSHQYVNEEHPFTPSYLQTDDLKLKQSQWAGASSFTPETELPFPQKTSEYRPDYSLHKHDAASPQSWTRSMASQAPQPFSTSNKQSESKLSDKDRTLQPNSHTWKPSTWQPQARPHTAPVPAQRSNSKPQPWKAPQVSHTDASPKPQLHNHLSSSQTASSNPSAATSAPAAASRKQGWGPGRGDWSVKGASTGIEGSAQEHSGQASIPPEPSRMPPLSPKQQASPQRRGFQHSRSKSSDSEHSSGDYGGVYCVSTGSVLYGVDADEAFKHQTTDERRLRQEPVDPERERRRKEEEQAYRKKRLEELYEEERLKKMKRDEADAEARRHHDFYVSAQKSPISPNRFDDAAASPLSPSQPGSLGTLERKGGSPLSVPPERRRGFQIQGKARALFNFTAQNPRELPFRKNDIIYLMRQVDKNWFEGERHGRVGIFPTNYVEVVTSIEAAQAAAMQAEGQGRAKYSFTAQSSVELSLRKGEFVVLLRRVDENWYEGRIGNRQGIFPVSYVEITREPSTPLITPAPSVITTPMTGTPEMLSPVGYDPAPTPPPQPSPSALSAQRGAYSYHPQSHAAAGFSSHPGASGSLLTPATSMSRQQISLNRQDHELAAPRSPAGSKSPLSPGKGSPGGRRVSPGPSPMSKLQVDIHSASRPYTNGPPPAAASSSSKVLDDDLALTRYRALYAYRPQNEDELELKEGDEVFVMEKCDDGWFVGTSGRSGCFGTFPGNYVQKI